MKKCSKCGQTKPLGEFSKQKLGKGGLRARCKTCENECARKYRERHIDAVRARVRRWTENNRELAREIGRKSREKHRQKRLDAIRKWQEANTERRRQYRQEHKDRIADNLRKWRANNPEKVIEGQRKRYAANPDKALERVHRRRARVRNASGRYTVGEWQSLKEFYNHTCLCCGRREPEIKLTPDHVVPLVSGGANSIDNIQPLCRSCNCKKNKKYIDYRPTAHTAHT